MSRPSTNGATFNWRGKGWLMIASSHWQFLGYDRVNLEPEWAVTCPYPYVFRSLDVANLRRPFRFLKDTIHAGGIGRISTSIIVRARRGGAGALEGYRGRNCGESRRSDLEISEGGWFHSGWSK